MNKIRKFILPLGVSAFIAVALLSGWSILKLQEAIYYERNANKVQDEIDDFYQTILSAEASQRGFLLTGSPESLATFQKIIIQLPISLEHLKDTTKSLAIDPNLLQSLDTIVRKKLAELEGTVLLREARGQRQSFIVIPTSNGEKLTSEFRATLEQVENIAKAHASSHERFFQRYTSVLLGAIGAGTTLGLILIFAFAYLTQSEIKRRAKIEKDLRTAQDAALVASKMKSQFLATVSHEVRTPLNGIIGTSDLLRSRMKDSENKKFVEIIHNAGHALLKIVNEILDFSKIEAGKIDFEYSEFSILDMIEMNAELFSAKAHETKNSIYTYVGPDVPQVVLGDSSRLSQILRNFISNAIKFTNNGDILISATVKYYSGSNLTIRFEIKDTGKGITKEDQEILFQPFNQIHKDGEIRTEGTGLGLSICKELVERMGGKVGLESNPNTGSNFWFDIPFELNDHQKIADLFSATVKRKAVLYIGKPSLLDEVIKSYARELNLNIKFYNTIQEVVLIERNSAIVILSIDEVNDGIAADLKQFENFQDSVVIVLTNNNYENVDLIPSKLNPMYLRKPFSREELVRALTETLPTQANGDAISSGSSNQHSDSDPIVLVAEDNITNQILVEALLKDLGFRVHLVASGIEALEALTRIPYDLILMDCQMPIMNGFQATKEIRLRESNLGTQVPIIALTANASPQDREKCLASGMNDFLSKPFDRKDLSTILNKWIKLKTFAPVSWTKLTDLAAKTNNTIVKRMIDSFLITLPKAIIEIEKAQEANNMSEIQRWAHHLRSSSTILGAIELGELCQEAEEKIEVSKSLNEVSLIVKNLIDCGDRTKKAFENQKLFL